MRLILTMAIMISSLSVVAQSKQTQDVPLCDATSFFRIYPCLVPVKDGYTQRNYHPIEATSPSQTFTGFSTIKFQKWVMFDSKGKSWYVDNPEDHNGEFILHLNTKKLVILNDSTVIYKP